MSHRNLFMMNRRSSWKSVWMLSRCASSEWLTLPVAAVVVASGAVVVVVGIGVGGLVGGLVGGIGVCGIGGG